MARVSLTELSTDPAVDLRTPAPDPARPVSPEVRKSGSRWDDFERKETRLRADQLEALTGLARSLNRQRRGQGQRITENTLIRVAVDLLLDQQDQLAGIDEPTLRASMRPPQ